MFLDLKTPFKIDFFLLFKGDRLVLLQILDVGLSFSLSASLKGIHFT